MDALLKRCVYSNVEWLTQARASSKDVDDLNSQIENLVENQRHHVAGVSVKKDDWLNPRRWRVHHKVRAKDLLNSDQHAPLIHPHSFLACVDGNGVEIWQFFLCNMPTRRTFEDDHWRQMPAAVMANAPVALFVPFPVLRS
jgi:hypothetical protein